MKKILPNFIIVAFCLLWNNSQAQQYVSVEDRKEYAENIRREEPGISQSELRLLLHNQFKYKQSKSFSKIKVSKGRGIKAKASGNKDQSGKKSIISATTFNTTSAFNSVPDNIEYLALKAIFESTGGANWINKQNWPSQNWPASTNVTWRDFATWYGIDVENGDVVNLKFAANNLVGSLPPQLGDLTALQFLDFNDNQISSLPEDIGALQSLIFLYLNNNNLSSLPDAAGQLGSLYNFQLNNNQLTKLPEDLGGLVSLQDFYVSHNQLDSLPQSIGQLPVLNFFNCYNNNLEYIPSTIGQLGALTQLMLDNNSLNNLPSEIGQLQSLQSLTLSGNQFTSLPGEIGNLANLYSLLLSDNEFTEFPSAIFGLANLNYLYLDNNQLTTLPDSISELANLTDLHLSGNQLTVFPEQVYGLPFLFVLNLNGNQITELPATIDTMQGLWDLFINDNQLTALPSSITNMPLWSLRIGGNPISEIPSQIYEMSATLFDLDISRMQLTSLPLALAESMNLEVLQVKGNKLDFGDLEPFFTAPGESAFPYFDYSPQEEIGIDTTLMLPVGASLDFNFAVSGQHNRYYWEKLDRLGKWIPLDSAGNGINRDFLTKLDEGLLRLRIVNEWVNGLTIYSRPIPVEVYFQNYVREETIYKEGIKEPSEIDALQVTEGEKSTNWIYYDGLQRSLQAIGQEHSAQGNDGIQAMDYDALVRQNVGYLPYTSFPMDSMSVLAPGSFRPSALTREQPTFYKNPPPTVAGESKYPFSQAVFEDSPLGRPLRQGSPGQTWRADSGRVVNYAYEKNQADEVLHWTIMPDGTLRADSTYLEGELRKTVVTDENGNVSISYADKFGKSIHQKSQIDNTTWLSTYMVYDQFNNLRFRIPPKVIEIIAQQTSFPKIVSADNIALYCFSYQYDNQDRPIGEKAPGAEPIYFVYDKWDRMILSQTGNQRKSNQWSFTKYDMFNRPVVSGFTIDSRQLEEIRTSLQQLTDAERFENRDASGPHGYSSNSYPNVISDVLAVSYYDDYSFLEDELTDSIYRYKPVQGLPEVNNKLVDGFATGSKSRILGTNRFIWTVNYFDEDLDAIQTVSSNHIGGVDRSITEINFAGWVIKTTTTHFEGNSIQVDIVERSDFDHTGRVVASYHQINDQPEVQIASFKYNELGEFVEKNLHVTSDGPLQSVDYRKNIRGWLNSINNAQLASGNNNDDEDDYFGMEAHYNDFVGDDETIPLYNGMISAVTWSNAIDTVKQRRYNYSYDKSYRLRSATHHEKSLGWQQTSNYNESQSYDENGNITNLSRTDGQGNLLDVLQYTYDGNQLIAVTDDGDDTKGFKDVHSGADDYAYDANGNLVKDRNLGIDTIYYYHFNKPDSLVFSNGTRIKYVYDAVGMKLSHRLYNLDTLLKVHDYIGEFIYTDSSLNFIQHPEGRLTKSKADNTKWAYEYHLTDYLGNIRVTFTSEPWTETFMATMESQEASNEETQFLKLSDSRSPTSSSIDHTKKSNSPKVVRLNGYRNIKDGPAKGLQVMPGDKVRMEVYVKYLDMRKADPKLAATMVLATLASGGIAGTPGDPGGAIQTTSHNRGGVLGLLGNTEDLESPKSFLNYYLFDSHFNQINAGFTQVSKAAAITAKEPKGKHEKLTLEVEIEHAGYLFTNLSADGNENVDVYFDDFTIIHEHGYIVQVQDYYPYGSPFNTKIREHSVLNKYLYQGKELQDSTNWYDFHSRQYSSDLGRFLGVDPKGQFANPYNGMGNNPVMGVDPDGQWVNFVIGAVVGAVGGYSTGKALGKSGWDLFAYTMAGAGIGAATAGIGSAVTAGTSATLGATGSTLVGGTVAGAVNGAAMAGLGGGNVGQGALYGSIGGLAGSTAGLANVNGIAFGALYGATTGGLISGGINELNGGSFRDGFRSGAISGGIMGGISGGIAASNSKYERNILTGGFTRSGKISALKDASAGTGVNNISIRRMDGANAETRPIVNGVEMNISDALSASAGSGTQSNIYFKSGRPLRAMIRTLNHELVHVSDIYSGRIYADYLGAREFMAITTGRVSHANAARIAMNYSEIRAWNVNIAYGQNGALAIQQGYYQQILKIYEAYYIHWTP